MDLQTFSQKPYFLNIIYTILVFLVIYLLASIARRLINRHVHNLKRRHRMRKISFYTCGAFLIVALLEIWTSALPSFTTIISFVGAGLALALHEVVLCFAGWLLINIKKPYEVGERIEVNNIKGDVIDIGVFQTFMIEVGNWVAADQSTGRIISLPNSSVFRHAVYNYTKEFPFIWNELSVLVTFESNWQKAHDLILTTAQENVDEIQNKMNTLIERMSYRYLVHYNKLTPVVYTKIADCGVLLTLRYLTDAKKRRTSENEISRAILESFGKERDIDFAYPTTRFYDNIKEGKHAKA